MLLLELGQYIVFVYHSIQTPDFIAKQITSFGELSKIVKEDYTSELVADIAEIGTNGVITKKGYTRVDECIDALECSIGFISNPSNS